MDNQFTFAACAALLRANGFAPAPLASDGRPLGPHAVQQISYHKYATNDELPVAVLTAVPAPRNEQDPVQNYRDTHLATASVSVRDELKADVDAIVKRCVGQGRLPVRIADGEALYVFKLAAGAQPFSTLVTSYCHQPDTVRIESAASFVPLLNGQWKDGISLLDVFRNELPALSRDSAQALIDEVDRLLADRAPAVTYVLSPRAPRPLLEPGQTLRWKNARALDVLRENGFPNLLPVRWGQQEAERQGYNDANGRFHYTADVSEHGVGLPLRGFALLEFVTRYRADVHEAILSLGACIVRTVPGEDRPVYLFRCDQGGGDETIYSPGANVKVRRSGVIVLSGADDKGREYKLSRDLLSVKASELAAIEQYDGQRLQRVLESLPPADYSKGTGKRRKAAA